MCRSHSGDGRLAAAYRSIGDEAAVDRLAATGPDAAAQIADLLAADREWAPAIAYYDRALAAAPDDGAALAGRAAAHLGAGDAERADADWLRAVALQPRLGEVVFQKLGFAGRFVAASGVGRRLVDDRPSEVLEWLRAAPAVALAGDRAAYVEFIDRMLQRFAASANANDDGGWIAADALCRAGALLPDGFDLARLPGEVQGRALDENLVPERRAATGWVTRALLDYRKDDLESATRSIHRAEQYEGLRDPYFDSLRLAVRALLRHARGDDAAARSDVRESARLSEFVISEGGYRLGWKDSDRLTPLLLLREAEALLGE